MFRRFKSYMMTSKCLRSNSINLVLLYVFNNLIMDLVELILFILNSTSELQCVFILPILIFMLLNLDSAA